MAARPVLPPALRRPLGTVAAVAALVVTGLGVLYAAGGKLGPWDGYAMPLEGFKPPWRSFSLVVDYLGEPVGAVLSVAAVAGAAVLLRRPRAAVLVVAAVGLGGALSTAVKPLVGRPIHVVYLAYPSGHTATLTTIGLVSGLLVADRIGARRGPGLAVVLGLGTLGGAAMSYAETMLSAHYLTDTIAGYCLALAVVPALALVIDKVGDRIAAARTGRAAEPQAGLASRK